jgi:hypothetical protein
MTLDHTARRRSLLLGFTMAVAGLAATLFLLFSPGRGQAQPSFMSMSMSMSMSQPKLSAKAVAFRAGMDKLWEDHITWTRMVIVDFAAGLPDLKTAEARLLRNQADIGNAIKPFYGRAAGNELTKLLRTHILEAIPVLEDAKADNTAKVAQDQRAWHANAHQIAVFLSKANPRNWPLGMMETMMNRHLALTTKEAVARLTGKWQADVAAYDQVHTEILGMSAMLSNGIIRQFPNRF